MICEICGKELNFVGGNWYECGNCGSYVQVKKYLKACEICGGGLQSIGNKWYKCSDCSSYVKEGSIA